MTIQHPEHEGGDYNATCRECGPVVAHPDYGIAHAISSDHQQMHQMRAHDDLYGQGSFEQTFPHLFASHQALGAKIAATDGKIVGLCPGCNKAIRKHTTPHGDELRHLHNNHVRCFSTTAGVGADVLMEGAGNALNSFEKDQEKEQDGRDDWAYKANGFEASLRYQAGDYLGRPDAANPTGRGADEFRARTWDGFLTTRPFQSPDDRNVNTPVLPNAPIKTKNINTPTPGLRDSDSLEQGGEDDDEDED